jgi:hypothetical protein
MPTVLDLPYGSPAWHQTYATLRNTIEGLNGYAKDPARQALAQPGRRRVRGIAAQSLFTALLLIAANIRTGSSVGNPLCPRGDRPHYPTLLYELQRRDKSLASRYPLPEPYAL